MYFTAKHDPLDNNINAKKTLYMTVRNYTMFYVSCFMVH